MTTHFYIPPAHIHGERVTLPPDEARHAARALRLGAGDELVAVDGKGGWYRVVLDHAGRSEAAGHIVERRRDIGEPPYHLTLAVGLIKHRGRYETFLEKAVELGAARIVPLLTHRTEKEGLRAERSHNILVAAMKQCGRSRLPQLQAPARLDEVIGTETGLGICCHESQDPKARMAAVLGDERAIKRMTVLVGPEGGFTEAEIETVRAAGFEIVSLGRRRLRSETAAITAAAAVALLCDSW